MIWTIRNNPCEPIQIIEDDTLVVAWIAPGDERTARLVAAAPDLLGACEMAMEIFRDFDLGHLVAFDLLDRAINKAGDV